MYVYIYIDIYTYNNTKHCSGEVGHVPAAAQDGPCPLETGSIGIRLVGFSGVRKVSTYIRRFQWGATGFSGF